VRHTKTGPQQHADGRASRSTRRQFLELTSAAALTAAFPRMLLGSTSGADVAFRPHLLSSADEIWAALESMNNGGEPRFCGNAAHRRFIDSLESDMKQAGLQTARDSYTFPRWEAKSWKLSATGKNGEKSELPVTYFYPHSGETDPEGVTAPIVYGGKIASGIAAGGVTKPTIQVDMKGKIVLFNYEIVAAKYNEWFRKWGFSRPDVDIPEEADGVGSWPHDGWDLTEYKKGGAVGVIFAWSNLSDRQAHGQNWPFGHANQGLPSLVVSHETGEKLHRLADEGGSATIVLQAEIEQNASTDTLYATLPGASTDESLIVYTHTDGPNVVQENAGIALAAMAKYFSKLPQGSRKRTLVFVMVTGHDYGAYVPAKQGNFIQRHPEIIKKAIAGVTIEHLGCMEWRDNATHSRYAATGRQETCYAQTRHETLARLMSATAPAAGDHRAAVVEPNQKVRFLGMGGALAATGMPTLGYFPGPSYLNIVAPDGCMSKLSKTLMHDQVTSFAKLLHQLDTISPSELKWLPPSPRTPGASAG
jgi:hypothetical protein